MLLILCREFDIFWNKTKARAKNGICMLFYVETTRSSRLIALIYNIII